MTKKEGQNIEERIDELSELDQKEQRAIATLRGKIGEAGAETKEPLPNEVYLKFKEIIDSAGGVSTMEEFNELIDDVLDEGARERISDFMYEQEQKYPNYDMKNVLPDVLERYVAEKSQSSQKSPKEEALVAKINDSDLTFSDKVEDGQEPEEKIDYSTEISPDPERTRKEAWKKDYYDMLGVSRDASEDQIQKAFNAIREDYFGKNKRLLTQVEWVYIQKGKEVLLNSKKRKKYDESLSERIAQKEKKKTEPVKATSTDTKEPGSEAVKTAPDKEKDELKKAKEALALVEKVLAGNTPDKIRYENRKKQLLAQIAGLEGKIKPRPEEKPVMPAETAPAPETLSGADTIHDGGVGQAQEANKLQQKWDELGAVREEYNKETDKDAKEVLLGRWQALYKEVKDLYDPKNEKKFREDIQKEVEKKPGVRLMKEKNARKLLVDAMEAKLRSERKRIETEVRQKMRNDYIQENWKQILSSGREGIKYKDAQGVISPDVYARAMEDKLYRANQELRKNVDDEGKILELSPEIFHGLIRAGYQPDQLKGRILDKTEGRAVSMSLGGLVGVGSVLFGPVGWAFGGTATALGFSGEKLFSKRLYGGVKLPHQERRAKTMSQEDFEALIAEVERNQNKFVTEEVKKEIARRREQELLKIEGKLKESKERFNTIKQTAAGKLIRRADKKETDVEQSGALKPEVTSINIAGASTTKELYEALLASKEPKALLAAKELKNKVKNINAAISNAFKTNTGEKLSKNSLTNYLKDAEAMPAFKGKLKDIFINVVMNEIEKYKKSKKINTMPEKEPMGGENLNNNEGLGGEDLEQLKKAEEERDRLQKEYDKLLGLPSRDQEQEKRFRELYPRFKRSKK